MPCLHKELESQLKKLTEMKSAYSPSSALTTANSPGLINSLAKKGDNSPHKKGGDTHYEEGNTLHPR